MTKHEKTYDRATVCERYLQGDQGGGYQFFVRAPDGYLIECGSRENRAQAVCDAINGAREPGAEWPPEDDRPF